MLADKNEALQLLKADIDALKTTLEESQRSLSEVSSRLISKEKEWLEKESSLNAKILEVETSQVTSSQSSLTIQDEFNRLKNKYAQLEVKKDDAVREANESNALIHGELSISLILNRHCPCALILLCRVEGGIARSTRRITVICERRTLRKGQRNSFSCFARFYAGGTLKV
jgi:hypothetical protein